MSDFKRVMFEDWAIWIMMGSFGIFMVIFLLVSFRAMRLGKSEREKMASLPLE